MPLLSVLAEEINLLLLISIAVLALGLLLKQIHQPYILAYILTGILLGPDGIGVVTDITVAEHIGEVGLIMLMFFIGMEISLPDFLRRWRIALLGTGMQIGFSLLLIGGLGLIWGWSLNRIVLLAFIISISSSAVVIKLVEGLGPWDQRIGQNVISILLTQDILVVPMIIVISFLGGASITAQEIFWQILGGLLVVGVLFFLLIRKKIRLPFEAQLRHDHELQIFAALIVCFGAALTTSLFGLSASLGALVAGILIHASDANEWLHDSLHAFRVVLVSIFFLSVGMLIDLDFLWEHSLMVGLLVGLVYVANQGINFLLLRLLGSSWAESLLGAAMLAQIGEFSFVLASIGYQAAIISQYAYQLTLIVIAITIFISPLWVLLIERLVRHRARPPAP